MAATWKILKLNRDISLNGKSDVVKSVVFEVIDSETVGSEDNAIVHNGYEYGFINLNTSDLSSFTSYADITESNVINWVKSTMGNDEVAVYEQKVADQIKESKTPTEATGVPW